MLNAGSHTNNTLFAISLKPLPHLGLLAPSSSSLDGRNEVVGHVTKALDSEKNLSKVFCYKGVPLDPVTIKDCGVLSP